MALRGCSRGVEIFISPPDIADIRRWSGVVSGCFSAKNLHFTKFWETRFWREIWNLPLQAERGPHLAKKLSRMRERFLLVPIISTICGEKAFFIFLWTKSQNCILNFVDATRKCEKSRTSENALFPSDYLAYAMYNVKNRIYTTPPLQCAHYIFKY